MRFMVVSRIDDAAAVRYTRDLGQFLESEGHSILFEQETARVMGVPGESHPENRSDLAVVVGGDGTILFSVQRMEKQIPILGINWGEVGFLADVEPEDAESFLRSIRPGFAIEPRMRISLTKDGEILGHALNEALIVTSRPAKMLRFTVVVDGVPADRFRSDGILISTPTGSTAYAMSAGGPIVDPRIQGFLIVPLAPYMLSSRPHLISNDRTLEIRLESAKPATLVMDGQQSFQMGISGSIEVRKSSEPALFVDAKKNFFEKVDSKLRHL
ncbi:MAG: NAD(+)/NADH kinase [Methanolinea sp.]|nr:NAD(+)/NADH kinase [Methanolinea sp.]